MPAERIRKITVAAELSLIDASLLTTPRDRVEAALLSHRRGVTN
jgi:hypothetical protein